MPGVGAGTGSVETDFGLPLGRGSCAAFAPCVKSATITFGASTSTLDAEASVGQDAAVKIRWGHEWMSNVENQMCHMVGQDKVLPVALLC